MATKLFPPIIENKLPAFAGHTMTVPFAANRAVSMTQVQKMAIIIKTVQTGTVIADNLQGSWTYDDSTGNYIASFELGDLYSATLMPRRISPGQFYKVQLAYIDHENTIGYFSVASTIKCTTIPTISIPSLHQNYFGSCEYTGHYGQSEDGKDISEKVHTYQFFLKDAAGNLIATSGEQIHDSANDDSTSSSHDTWSINLALSEGVPYYVSYRVITMNGYVAESPSYLIIPQESIDPSLPCKLIATPNFDEGCIKLALRPITSIPMNGSFVLSRASSDDNYGSWHEIYRFSYRNVVMTPRDPATHPSDWDINDLTIWEDFTTKQGVNYVYALQAYNSQGLYSSRVLNMDEYMDESWQHNPDLLGHYKTVFRHDPVYMDFEDAFLFDGERQLRLRFNPKVSSFKSTILESKLDTLGGKYPFIMRNGNVEYKEFPISGLLSLVSDRNSKFLDGIQRNIYVTRDMATDLGGNYDSDIQLTAENLRRERDFKMFALSWLTNGKPKLFRSPAEGNFIVRLMNTSLAPNDTVGRMLHTFTSTAYEIATCDFANLNYYGFIKSPIGDNRDFKVAQLIMADLPSEFPEVNGQIQLPNAYFVNITEATPGTIVGFNFGDGTGTQYIEIGLTGCYYIPFKDKPLKYISLVSGHSWDGAKLTFCYYDDAPTDNFSVVTDLSVKDEIRQFIGVGYPDTTVQRESYNIINMIEDVRRQTGRFHYIKVTQRPKCLCYQQNGNIFSRDPEGIDVMSGTDWNETIIYEVHSKTSVNTILGYMYGRPGTISKTKPDYRFSYNGSSVIDMSGNTHPLNSYVCRDCHHTALYDDFVFTDASGNAILNDYEEPVLQCPSCNKRHILALPSTQGRIDALTNIDKVETLYAGSGVILDVAYHIKEIEYSVESTDPTLSAKNAYLSARNSWLGAISDELAQSVIDERRRTMQERYAYYVTVLEQAIKDALGE